MTWIIFLIETRHYHELNKIGITSFGSTIYEIHIFESIYKSVKRIKQPENGKPNPTAGLARKNTAAREAGAGVAQNSTRPRSGSRLSTVTDARVPHDRETDRGGRKDGGVARRQ